MNIYVASSWRNSRQPEAVQRLRNVGYEVYDFRHPDEGDNGFQWSEIDAEWQQWTPGEFRDALQHPLAMDGYSKDFAAMVTADLCVLVLPCGRSAHLEAGYFVGRGVPVVAWLDPTGEPELMYKMLTALCVTFEEVITAVGKLKHGSE
jgi:hypothetical protein